ncbi:MAG: hypothetical protein M3209_01480 [Acidobacteriota bacterium]|nr:hypothetical protein [Acidobacteriota bacterium]
MNLKLTRLHLLDKTITLARDFKSGISLHCHTQHSREMLDFVPHYAEQLPIIKNFWERERKNYIAREGKGIDFSEGYWTPPLSAAEVFNLERGQINRIGLEAIVSLTDHDEIEANRFVRREIGNAANAPISLEWTVPFEGGFFHVGVHNLPENRAEEITKDLLDFTFARKRGLIFGENHLDELFALLNGIPEVLVILNHPLWDIEMFGKERHRVLLDAFLEKHGRWIHAFEINGFRKWSENKAVLEMADELGYPVVSGGDRHGCQCNSVVNLTTVKTFSEFTEQIRVDKRSEVVLMPHYRQPLKWRQLQSFAEILKNYPEFGTERRHWQSRVFMKIDERGALPLASFWDTGGPRWLKMATWTLGAFGSRAARPAFALMVKRKDRLPKSFNSQVLATKTEEEQMLSDLSSDVI